MADQVRQLYWDTSCFICFLNRSEIDRRAICEDILRNAKEGNIRLFTSTFTITEVMYPKRSSIPNPRRLTRAESDKIAGMFKWSWLRKIDVDQRIAQKAVEYCRDYDMLPSDAVHAATAVLRGVEALQNWDRDFSRIRHLVTVESPSRISTQASFDDVLARLGPHPDDFRGTGR